MYSLGKKSQREFDTLHSDLQAIILGTLEIIDISVQEGIRSDARQYELYTSTPPRTTLDGKTRKSKHQGRKDDSGKLVSFAADITPYIKNVNPYENSRKNLARFYFMMGIVNGVASKLLKDGLITHKIRFGLDWDGDHLFTDQNFDDLPHMEIIPV